MDEDEEMEQLRAQEARRATNTTVCILTTLFTSTGQER
jgi:hypothetical protein